MASNRVWNLMYVAGNPAMFSKVTANATNPLRKSEAMDCAATVSDNGWRVWIEHKDTGERIFESAAEKQHHQAAEAA